MDIRVQDAKYNLEGRPRGIEMYFEGREYVFRKIANATGDEIPIFS